MKQGRQERGACKFQLDFTVWRIQPYSLNQPETLKSFSYSFESTVKVQRCYVIGPVRQVYHTKALNLNLAFAAPSFKPVSNALIAATEAAGKY